MDFKDVIIYPKTNLSDILKEIHQNSKSKENEIRILINNLKPLLVTAGDAVILVPLITQYLQVSVKNDDNLIKMASIVQRAISSGQKDSNGDVLLSEEEKAGLMEISKNLSVV